MHLGTMDQLSVSVWHQSCPKKDQEKDFWRSFWWWKLRGSNLWGLWQGWAMHRLFFFLLTQLNNFHSDPYVCEDWKETEFCSDKCDESSTKLVTRACFPIQDPLPEQVEPPVLIKPGNSRCNSYSHCTGDNNLTSNQVKKTKSQENRQDGQNGPSARATAAWTGFLDPRKEVELWSRTERLLLNLRQLIVHSPVRLVSHLIF